MNISSMTGFSRLADILQVNDKKISFVWEIKSVNAKALDVKFRLPFVFDSLSLPLRNILEKHIARGTVSVSLDVQNSLAEQSFSVNESFLKKLASRAIDLCVEYPNEVQKPSAAELLAVKGVIESQDASLSDAEKELCQNKLLESFAVVCQNLQADRQKEGLKMKEALSAVLQKIAAIVGQIENLAKTTQAEIKEKLNKQIAELAGGTEVSEDRLAQEVLFLVNKADIKEEIDRLKAHLKTAEALLNSKEPVGRRLDFLCQEFNREANTTCSKSFNIELTNLGMELKVLIEQFREQVQNIE